MSKYTPGPWKWELVEGNDKDDSLLVLMTEANEIPVGFEEADRMLMSAAPELLEFAQEWLSRQGDDENYMTAKAKAAISKATGE